jgi:hypothetical protein
MHAPVAKPCAPSAKKLSSFKRTMAQKRRAYFRRHSGKRQRRAFVKRQQAQLRGLQRAHARCLKRAKKPKPKPQPQPPPQPQPQPVDATPPQLSIATPVEGSWFEEPRAVVTGSATDAGGVTSLTCAGQAAVLVGHGFTCEVPLAGGGNAITVRATDAAGNTSSASRTLNHAAGGLTGPPEASALHAVQQRFTSGAFVGNGETTNEPSGREVVRTLLEVGFEPGATVGQLNALLRAAGAQIVSSQPGVAIALVRIPDPGSLTSLETIRAQLAANPLIRFAVLESMTEPDELPGNVDLTLPDPVSEIEHHLAVRAPAAWNARGLLSGASASAPTLVVGDSFGAGPPPETANGVDVLDAGDFGTSNFTFHGYHVLGIAAAQWDPSPLLAAALDAAVGMFPGTLPLRAADATAGLSLHGMEDRVLALVRATNGNVVVNTSLGFGCKTETEDTVICNEAEAKREALIWIEKVRGTVPGSIGIEGKFLHLTSAGNVDVPGRTNARFNSPWTAARSLSPLTVGDPAVVVPNLSNLLSVENVIVQDATARCLSTESKRPGDLSAIGQGPAGIYSLGGPTTVQRANGTSMATPQVTGLAAYVWALSPQLTPQQVATLLTDTSRPAPSSSSVTGCDTAGAAPLIDAYNAVLSLDAAALPSPATAPVRKAILDVTGDGSFDQVDLSAFVGALLPGGSPAAPTAPDWGRFDLNGDGFTGGGGTAAFDLDRVGSERFGPAVHGTVMQAIEGLSLTFDETQLTDLDILCYYAYSGLFAAGSETARSTQLARPCANLTIEATFPPSVQPGVANTLTIRVLRNGVPQPGVSLEFFSLGGDVQNVTGTTGPTGVFTTQATLAPGAPQLTITVNAMAGTVELAEATVTATSLQLGTVVRIRSRGVNGAGAMANASGDSVFRASGAAATSFTDSISNSDSEEGETAVGNGSISFTESYAGATLTGATISSTNTATSSGSHASAEGFGDYTLDFRVGTSAVPYRVSGTLTSAGQVFLRCVDGSRSSVYIFRSSPPAGMVVDHCNPFASPAIDVSGTLQPGDYQFNFRSQADSVGSTTESASASITLTLGS